MAEAAGASTWMAASFADPEPVPSPAPRVVVGVGGAGAEAREGLALGESPLGLALAVPTIGGPALTDEFAVVGPGLESGVGKPGASR